MGKHRVIRIAVVLVLGFALFGPRAGAVERTVLYEHFTSPN